MKKVTALDDAATNKPQLSRREREEVEKAKAKAHYQKQHAAGKTEEARADLARLAIIRKQREDAAAKELPSRQRRMLPPKQKPTLRKNKCPCPVDPIELWRRRLLQIQLTPVLSFHRFFVLFYG